MTEQKPRGFNSGESKKPEKLDDKTNPNIEKFRRNLLSIPSETQKATEGDPYKNLSFEEKNKKRIIRIKKYRKNHLFC